MKKGSFVRRLLNAMLTFLFALVAIAFLCMTIIQNTLFSADFYTHQTDDAGLSATVLLEIQNSFRAYVESLDIDIEVSDDFVTSHITIEQVDEVIKRTIRAAFDESEAYDYSALAHQLFDDLEEYITAELSLSIADLPEEVQQQILESVDLSEQLEIFTTKFEEIFTSYVDMPVFSRIASMARTYRPVIQTGQIVSAIAALILLMLLLRLSPSWSDAFRNLMIAFIIVTLFSGVCYCAQIIPTQYFINRIGIDLENESLRLLVSQCVDSVIRMFKWPLIVSASIMFVLLVVYLILRAVEQRERD